MYLLTELSPFDLFDGGNGRWVWQDYLRQPVGLSLRWILNKMVQQATNRRYQSANQVLTDLSQPENVLMDDRTSQSSSIQDHSVSPNQTHASLNVSHEQGGQITPTSADTRRLQKKKEFLRNNFATRPLSLLEGLALGVVGLIAMPVASALVIILLRGAFGAFSFTLLIPWLLIGIVILLYFEGPP
jgi:hypothetical protein